MKVGGGQLACCQEPPLPGTSSVGGLADLIPDPAMASASILPVSPDTQHLLISILDVKCDLYW